MSYADIYNAETLRTRCTYFVDENARRVLKSQTMMILPKEHLKSILSRDSFLVNEMEIFEAVLKWKDYNKFEVEEMEDVLKCIRLTEISPEELGTVVNSSGMYSESTIREAIEQSQSSYVIKTPRGRLG